MLEQIDIVATHATIAAGLLDRLEKFMPGFEEGELSPDPDEPIDHSSRPVLVVASDGARFTVSRDREDELSSIACEPSRPQAARTSIGGRSCSSGRCRMCISPATCSPTQAIPYQTFDALPLAAEPYAAALDLVFEFVTSNFTREPVVALFSSPHFSFEVDGAPLRRSDIAAFNRALSDEGLLRRCRSACAHLPSRDDGRRRRQPPERRRNFGHSPETSGRRSSSTRFWRFSQAHDRIPPLGDPLRERHLRARSAVLSALHGLRRAHQHLDDSPVELASVAAMIRRWIEGQTFAPRAGTAGVQLLDAQAARYGEFDEVFLVGLVEGEWPRTVGEEHLLPGIAR